MPVMLPVCVCVLCFAVLFCSAILVFLIDKTYAPHVLQLQSHFLLRLISSIEVQFGLSRSPLLKEHIIIVTVIMISSCAASHRLIEKHNKTRFTTHMPRTPLPTHSALSLPSPSHLSCSPHSALHCIDMHNWQTGSGYTRVPCQGAGAYCTCHDDDDDGDAIGPSETLRFSNAFRCLLTSFGPTPHTTLNEHNLSTH